MVSLTKTEKSLLLQALEAEGVVRTCYAHGRGIRSGGEGQRERRASNRLVERGLAVEVDYHVGNRTVHGWTTTTYTSTIQLTAEGRKVAEELNAKKESIGVFDDSRRAVLVEAANQASWVSRS